MARSGLLWALLLVMGPTTGALADIYRWKDAAGVTHFTNAVPPEGATLIEITEETPYDAEADRQRLQEDRRLRLEREKLALEERKAELAAREQQAQLKLDEASRKLEEAEQQARVSAEESDRDDGFLRHGVYGPARRNHYFNRPGDGNLYRGYYREGGNLYTEDPRKPRSGPHQPPPKPPDRQDRSKEGPPKKKAKAESPPPAAGEEPLKAPQLPAPAAPARQ